MGDKQQKEGAAAPVRKRIRRLLRLTVLLVGLMTLFSWWAASYFWGSHVKCEDKAHLYIYPSMTLDDVVDSLKTKGLQSERKFRAAAAIMNYGESIKPGRYALTDGMSNRTLIKNLRAGIQSPIQFSFLSLRTLDDFARVVAQQLMFSEQDLLLALANTQLQEELGVRSAQWMTRFIPNTYELYWTVSPEAFLRRMQREYDAWWTPARIALAEEMNLTPAEVSILASIVEAETNQNEERPDVAGVYVNRLRKGMRLEADPTIKFALQDFEIKRVLNRHLEAAKSSPYSTYAHAGLPPGPINCPSIPSLKAVLHPRAHDYLFFCASAERQGFHTFSRTLVEHNRAAKEYHKWLNQQRIYK